MYACIRMCQIKQRRQEGRAKEVPQVHSKSAWTTRATFCPLPLAWLIRDGNICSIACLHRDWCFLCNKKSKLYLMRKFQWDLVSLEKGHKTSIFGLGNGVVMESLSRVRMLCTIKFMKNINQTVTCPASSTISSPFSLPSPTTATLSFLFDALTGLGSWYHIRKCHVNMYQLTNCKLTSKISFSCSLHVRRCCQCYVHTRKFIGPTMFVPWFLLQTSRSRGIRTGPRQHTRYNTAWRTWTQFHSIEDWCHLLSIQCVQVR